MPNQEIAFMCRNKIPGLLYMFRSDCILLYRGILQLQEMGVTSSTKPHLLPPVEPPNSSDEGILSLMLLNQPTPTFYTRGEASNKGPPPSSQGPHSPLQSPCIGEYGIVETNCTIIVLLQ